MPADPNRVKELFLTAADRPAAERPAFVAGACGGDADLRAEVERLLAAHAAPDSRIDPSAAVTRDVASPTADHRPADTPGLVLAGRYKLVEPIGEGGMGAVWMAQQVEPVKRAVAVKLIKAGMDSKSVLARFEAERQALALMDHPNIAKVLDGGLTPDGRPFFTMELVKGTPITRFCDSRKLTPRERLELFVPVCQAVQHAHQKGIIHRDLKPSNVLVALYDDRPVPKVIDFGVAKAAGQSLTDQTLMTGFGAVVGTPEYMSPEQASFNQLDVDTRSDVYSLGVLLYELLTGSPPFAHKELQARGVLEVLRVVREEEPPRPSDRLSTSHTLASIAAVRGTEPARLTRLVRGELDWLVMKALEKDRSRRYETANGLAADVQRYLAGEPVQAVPPSAGYRLRKFTRRHRAGVLTAIGFALLLVAGAAFSTWQAVRATLAEAREADHRRAAEDSEQAAVAAAEAADAERGRAVEARRGATAALDRERLTAYAHRIALAHREYLANNVDRARQLLADCPSELRGWEWGYVHRLCHAELTTFRGHRGGVMAVAFSPDGTRAASAGVDGVRVWDPATGRELLAIPGVTTAIAFAPVGRRLAVRRSNGVTIYDPTDGREVLRIITDISLPDPKAGPPQPVYRTRTDVFAFSPDGRRLATAGVGQPRAVQKREPSGQYGGVVRVWDTDNGKELPQLAAGLPTPATAVAFSPDGKHLAATASGVGSPGTELEFAL